MKVVSIPKSKFYLAYSGGVDSSTLFHFFRNGHKNFEVIHFDHGTDYGKKARNLVEQNCLRAGIKYITLEYTGEPSEVNWSIWRNNIMQNMDYPVLTGHHLNDSIESYLMRLSPISPINGNVIRPLITATKEEIVKYAESNNLIWLDDPSNKDSSYKRNKIRNELIPLMKECGIDPLNLMRL